MTITISDTYTGDLKTHEVQRLDDGRVTLYQTSVGPMDNNVYVVLCQATHAALLVDAADDVDHLLALVDTLAPDRLEILTTHAHPDHWLALDAFLATHPVPTYASAGDGARLPRTPSMTRADGDTLTVGEVTLDVIGLRGHTPDGLALALDIAGTTHLLIGDSLFPGGLGKTPDDSAFARLYKDVTTRVFDRFDDTTVVHPGHGRHTTLGAERPHLTEWRARGW